MTNALRLISTLIVICASTFSCVSVKLATPESSRATGVRFEAPGNGFEKDKREDVDQAWRQPKNGNVISYLSDCQDVTDPTLDSIVQGAMSGLNAMTIDSSETTTIQDREGRRVMASGKVDGVASRLDLLVFKRNHCIFMLSYVGVEKAFPQNHADFKKFISGFRAP